MFKVPFVKKNIKIDRNRIVNSVREHAKTLQIPNPWPLQSTVISSIAAGSEDVWQDQELFQGILPVIKEFIDLSIGQNVKMSCHMWYNIYNEGYHQEQHNHNSVGTLASGIVYVQMPTGTTGTTFINPSKSLYNACEYKQEYTISKPNVIEGDCVVFPPWLEHRVDKQHDIKGTRVTVAFNISNN